MAITTQSSLSESNAAAAAGRVNASSPSSGSNSGSDSSSCKIKQHHPVPTDAYEESVYSLIPIEYTPPAKQNMYRSKYAEMARNEYKSGTKEAASMGPAKVAVRTTDGFLKKGDREKKASPGKNYESLYENVAFFCIDHYTCEIDSRKVSA
jgi:hypothetical protein